MYMQVSSSMPSRVFWDLSLTLVDAGLLGQTLLIAHPAENLNTAAVQAVMRPGQSAKVVRNAI